MKRLGILVIGLFGFVQLSYGQTVLDGVYVKEHIPTKKLIQYPHLREADVMWEKRIWRIIDTREKINFPLYYPILPITDRWSLWDIIVHHLTKEVGSLTPYYNFNELTLTEFGGDQFLYPLSTSDPKYLEKVANLVSLLGEDPTTPIQTVDAFGNPIDSISGFDPATGNPIYAYPPRDTIKIEAKDIVGWELKEDWFFEKQRSVMDVRIIGIAPIAMIEDPMTKQRAPKTLMWLYFPELRYILQNYFVYNRQNDAQRMSFDDLFWKRMFNSYIKKESNIYDRRIVDYTSGVDALLESENIKHGMELIEHDVWDL